MSRLTYEGPTTATAEIVQLKAAHRVAWASGDYPAVAEAFVRDVGLATVRAAALEPGTEVLPWASEDELVDLCLRATRDPAGTQRIRVAARTRTLAEHTFDHRVAILEGAWDTA